MKNLILYIPVLFYFCCPGVLSQAPEWNNPLVNQVNKEYPRAYFYHYPDDKLSFSNNRVVSPWVMVLNGKWQFKWAANPASCPKDFLQPVTDTGAWNEIEVPSNWEIKGYGKINHNVNTGSFTATFPNILPANYPVGLYRRFFPVPETWFERQILIRFEGVSAAFYLWLNGHYVGYSEDSKTGSEFNVTPYIKFGRINSLAVQVFSRCDGSVLEEREMQQMSGIEHNVCIYALENAAIGDFFVNAGLTDDYTNGIFKLSVKPKKYLKSVKGKFDLIVSLKDKANKNLIEPLVREVDISSKKDSLVKFEQVIQKPLKWSADTPNLYNMVILLKDKSGNIIDVVSAKIGFRKIEIKDGSLLINGSKVYLKGANRYEYDALHGYAADEKQMLKEIELLKQNNINAIRTCYFPPNSRWLELCDEYGVYVVDEANIELPEKNPELVKTIADKPEWKTAVIERVRNMVERDKNYPSVIIWSLGNQSESGTNFKAAADWVRKRDNSRLIQSEAIQLKDTISKWKQLELIQKEQ